MQHCGHLERTRSAPRGRTAADGADIPPGHSTGPDLYQARKKGRSWAGPGCASFPFPKRLPGSPPLFPGVAFRGFGAPPRGPLTVIATTARKGPTKAYSMHLLDTDGVTVGCGWRPGPPKISELAEQDFHAEPEMYLGCTRCFRHFTFPNTWMAVEPYAAQDSEASISLSSDTDESVDTQSDKEAIVLPEIE